MIQGGVLRSWSLLREPPCRKGERRLAIERESFPPESIDYRIFEEEAFGIGRVSGWDQGDVQIERSSPSQILLRFAGKKICGRYELRRMRWYPGNRWMLVKLTD